MRDFVAALADTFAMRGLENAMTVGLGIGALVLQGLAAERPATTRSMVQIGTAPKLGVEASWTAAARHSSGISTRYRDWIEAYADEQGGSGTAELENWFAAIAQTDLRMSTAALRLPMLCLAGRDDRVTPPDLVREMADSVPGAQFAIVPRSGHATPLDAPAETARLIRDFIDATGHDLGDHGDPT